MADPAAAMEMPFQGLATFLKSPIRDPKRAFGFVGIPYDCSTSFRPGTRFGPQAVRQASMMLTDGEHYQFATDPCAVVSDLGDIAITEIDPVSARVRIQSALHALSKTFPDTHMIFSGGDHSITAATLAYHHARIGKPLAVVHFDAHCDTWENHFGQAVGHGTWLRNVIDEGIVDPKQVVSLGLRSPVDSKTRDWLHDKGGHWHDSRRLERFQPQAFRDLIVNIIGKTPAYITFDIDVIDPGSAPGTGTPEPGGISAMRAIELLESLRAACNWLGMDVVEVNPLCDHAEMTAHLAATLLHSYIAMHDLSLPTCSTPSPY